MVIPSGFIEQYLDQNSFYSLITWVCPPFNVCLYSLVLSALRYYTYIVQLFLLAPTVYSPKSLRYVSHIYDIDQ